MLTLVNQKREEARKQKSRSNSA